MTGGRAREDAPGARARRGGLARWLAAALLALLAHALAGWLVARAWRGPPEAEGLPDAVQEVIVLEFAPAPADGAAGAAQAEAAARPPETGPARDPAQDTAQDPAREAAEAATPNVAGADAEAQPPEAAASQDEAAPAPPQPVPAPPLETPVAEPVAAPSARAASPPPAAVSDAVLPPPPPPRPRSRPPARAIAAPVPRPPAVAKPVRMVPRPTKAAARPALPHRAAGGRAAGPPPRDAAAAGNAAATAASPTIGASASTAEVASWRARLIAHLNRFKHYPPGGASGTAGVRFAVARDGQVVAASLASSAGDPGLDQEAVAMVRRASPVPAPPDGLGSRISLAVPVRFGL